ncbi:MAG TPA: replicative DNA helicase [Saprospiraceae bacterium]|jgi:replicative DNA helicase|nr:replicative DNA helicase [Saprospiraceae bacterium]
MPNPKQSSSDSVSNLRALKGSNDHNGTIGGKVIPQAVPVEEVILGAIMIDVNAMSAVLDMLSPEVFYNPAHAKIFAAMMRIFNKSQPIDLLTVNEELKKSGEIDEIGGTAYLAELTFRVGNSANIEHHARIVVQKYIQRELINVSNQIIQDSYEDTKDVFDILDEAEQNLYRITDNNLNNGPQTFTAMANQVRLRMEEMASRPEGLTGVSTGFRELDKLTSGWQPSDLVIIAARPSVGKTALVLSMAVNAAKKGFPVAIFSLEMSTLQMAQRIIAMEAEISSSALRDGKLSDDELKRFHHTLQTKSDLKIFVDDTPAINIFEMRAKCRRLKTQHNIQMIVIDYLQLMSAGSESKMGGNRTQEVSVISRALKGLAKELNVPVIALSQLSRALETRADKRPMLSDLRESGSIEQDADIVGFIYRPDYHNLAEEGGINVAEPEAELLIQKHRNGALGNIKMTFVREYARYQDPDDANHLFGFGSASAISDSGSSGIIRKGSRANDDDFIDAPF